jgi:hypothetical protein
MLIEKVEFNLTVDYSKTLQEMITAGKYDDVDINNFIVEENFPFPPELIGKKVDVSAELFYFGRPKSSRDVIAIMERVNYRPATLFELLTMQSDRPDLQRYLPVVALGSPWAYAEFSDNVPVVRVNAFTFELVLDFYDSNWDCFYYFLGVHK